MAKLKLVHYGNKAIYAYLCPVTLNGSKIDRGDFYNADPIDVEDNKTRFYQGRSATVEFDLSRFPDGLYEWKEAAGHRAVKGFIKIEGGEISQSWESESELIEDLAPLPELPDLEGTPKQINWAQSIRATAVRNGFPVDQAMKVVQAKAWIDNRSSLSKYGVK